MGIDINRIISVTFVIGSALPAPPVLVGLYIPRIEPLMGVMYGLKACGRGDWRDRDHSRRHAGRLLMGLAETR